MEKMTVAQEKVEKIIAELKAAGHSIESVVMGPTFMELDIIYDA